MDAIYETKVRTSHVHKVILPWGVPILTLTHLRCSSRAGLVHQHALSTANKPASTHTQEKNKMI